MERIIAQKLPLSGSELKVYIYSMGRDLVVLLSGGEISHIGSVVLAVPRESLDGNGIRSATASVLNLTGHKEEEICRIIVERAAARYNVTVLCSGGFHINGMSREEIKEVLEMARLIAEEI